MTAFPLARSMTAVEGGSNGHTAQPLVKTSPQSWAEADLSSLVGGKAEVVQRRQGRQAGTDYARRRGVCAGHRSAAAAVGQHHARRRRMQSANPKRASWRSAIRTSPRTWRSASAGNRDFFMNALNWLAQQENLIAIRPREPEDRRLTLTRRSTEPDHDAVRSSSSRAWCSRRASTPGGGDGSHARPDFHAHPRGRARGARRLHLLRRLEAAGGKPDGSSATKEKVFTVEADKINELRITDQGETILLKKSEAGWKMVEPTQTEADPPEAIGVAHGARPTSSSSASSTRMPTDLAQFGLAKPPITRRLQGRRRQRRGSLKLGDKNATQGELYAHKNDEKRVFLVSSFQETQLQPQAVRSARQEDPEVRSRQGRFAGARRRARSSIEMARSSSEWKVVKPVPSRSDYGAIEGFLSRLSSSNMSKLVEENPKDLAKYGSTSRR